MNKRQQLQQYSKLTDGNEEKEEGNELKTMMTSFSCVDNWHIFIVFAQQKFGVTNNELLFHFPLLSSFSVRPLCIRSFE